MRVHKSLILISALQILAATTLAVSSARAGGEDLPNFTDIGRQVEASMIDGARLLYWDQTSADALGIQTAPGRVGVKEFEDSVLKQLAFEIAEDPSINSLSGLAAVKQKLAGLIRGQKDRPSVVLEVELDHFGGAGRAGYIRLNGADGKPFWVNIKGIGITGMGTTKKLVAGPPSKTHAGHRDGSARTSEGISESINGLIASNELKYSGSRVIALITTNRMIKLNDDWSEPLTLIVRSPLRRMDRDKGESKMRPELDRIAESLGQANATRIFKGDFVNTSNMGYDGSVIDYGLFNIPNGYVPITTHEESRMFFETKNLFRLRPDIRGVYQRSIAFYLLNQMGLEEPRLQAMRKKDPRAMDRDLDTLAARFLALVTSENSGVTLDGSNHEQIDGNFKLQRVFRSALAEILMAPTASTALARMLDLGQANVEKPSAKFENNYRAFAEQIIKMTRAVAADKLGDQSYAENMRKIGAFKNRDLWSVWRRDIYDYAVSTSEKFTKSGNPEVVQNAIDDLVNENHWNTGDYSSSQMAIHTDEHATYLNLKARETDDGHHGLFAYPELPLLDAQASMHFWISLDGVKSTQKVEATLIKTEMGPYYQIKIPHGKFPVTTEPLRLWPETSGKLQDGRVVEIKGPPLFINQRMGLQADITKAPSMMRQEYGIKTDLRSEDFKKPEAAKSCRDIVTK